MAALPDYADFLSACAAVSEAERGALEHLLYLHGVAREYIEYSGNVAQIPFSDRVDILQFKGLDLLSAKRVDPAKLQACLEDTIAAQWQAPLPVASVLTPGGRDTVCLRLPVSLLEYPWQWEIHCEGGEHYQQDFVPAHLRESDHATLSSGEFSARELPFAPFHNGILPLGYHRLSLRCLADASAVVEAPTPEATLIVAPGRAFEPDWALSGQRLWGFSVQLYTLRSDSNWGIGDFADLRAVVQQAAAQGASFLVLNPLHALDFDAPEHCSPYSPSDRRRLNPLYIDVTAEPEFRDNPALQALVASAAFADRLARQHQGGQIDYAEVSALKREVLLQMFACFVREHLTPNTARARAFKAYVKSQGPSLGAFADFEAARLRKSGEAPDESDPRFTLYTQWLAESQLEACQQLARELGMRIGLIRDLAVGGDGSGAEVSLNDSLFRTLASIGAPPDPLAPQGQNWGLPPMDPNALRASGYSHYIDLLRANMAHCGALRIDHVMALMRLWWCPRHTGRGIGAYVHYPVDEMFAILRLESVRARCVVIGEDLGVVPPEVRTYISTSAIFSNILFYFEKYDGYNFKRPEHYNPKALTMVANHDVPTLAAWWNASDLRLRFELGLIRDEDSLHQQIRDRQGEKQQVLHWLGDQWLLPAQWQGDSEGRPFDLLLCAAIFRCCARSSSQLLSVQLEDLVLLESPVNIPGTSSEYPNWRRRLPASTQTLIASESGLRLLAGIQEERTLS